MPPGASVFAARSVYRLAYQSQRDRMIDRSHAPQAKLYRKLGEDYDHFEQPAPPRPKGMHATTYARLLAELEARWEYLTRADRPSHRGGNC